MFERDEGRSVCMRLVLRGMLKVNMRRDWRGEGSMLFWMGILLAQSKPVIIYMWMHIDSLDSIAKIEKNAKDIIKTQD